MGTGDGRFGSLGVFEDCWFLHLVLQIMILFPFSPSISARHGKREANRFGVTIRNILNMASNLTEENVTQIIQEKVVEKNPVILLYSGKYYF